MRGRLHLIHTFFCHCSRRLLCLNLAQRVVLYPCAQSILWPNPDRPGISGKEHSSVANASANFLWRHLLDLQYGLPLLKTGPAQRAKTRQQAFVQCLTPCLNRFRYARNFGKQMDRTIPRDAWWSTDLIESKDGQHTSLPGRKLSGDPPLESEPESFNKLMPFPQKT